MTSGNERSLVWREINRVRESYIDKYELKVNSNHIERRFLEDAGNVVLERNVVERYDNVKVNTTFKRVHNER